MANIRKKLVVIGGPTASGKTAQAIETALRLNTEIVSADSRQVYRELKIGSAPPSDDELSMAKHHLIGTHSVHDNLNVAQFAQLARAAIDCIWQNNETAVLAGGSGLYIQAVIHGLKDLPPRNNELRTEVESILNEKGLEYLAAEIQNLAHDVAQHLDLKNPSRIMRAWEVYRQCGLFPWQVGHNAEPLDAEISYVLLNPPREQLYKRINERVDEMISAGLEQEARELSSFQNLNALQTVGYREWWPYFRGEYNLTMCIDKIKQHSRNYAKRQVTWFGKYFDH